MNIFGRSEEKTHRRSKQERQADRDRKTAAKDKNDEALQRLQDALDKLGPMKDLSDLLGKG